MEFFEVTKIYDGTIRPPKPKFVVCVSFNEGIFFRINSSDRFRPCVKILQREHASFLNHDSNLECSPLEFDEYILQEAIFHHGVLGRIHERHIPEVREKVALNAHLSKKYVEHVLSFFPIY